MNIQRESGWNDDQIVQHIKKWAIERAKYGFNILEANRISEQELFPSEEMLKSRGKDSLLKLLPLTQDEHPEVRLVSAAFVFDVAPVTARHVLRDLMEKGGLTGILAWAVWSHKDPASAPNPESLVKQI